MKKKQFNEVIARKISVQQRRLSRKAIQARRRDWFSSLSNVGHMKTGLERHALLMASGVAIFESEPLPGMDTIFGETELRLAQRKAAASKRTIDFVRDPYKFNGCTRGDKLTRAERKLLLDKVKHFASVEGITVTRRQIIQIVNCYCPYKTVIYVPADPFEARLRTKRHHMRWVVRLARICLTYVQLGSDFPMWTYYKSGRSFTYAGIDKLAQTVSYNSGVGVLAYKIKEMGAPPKLVSPSWRTSLEHLQAMSSKHHLPKDES